MKLLVVFFAIAATVSTAPPDIKIGSVTSGDTIPLDNYWPVDIWKHFFGKELLLPTISHTPVIPPLPNILEIVDISGLFDLNQLPDHYNNSTHQVHIVNGNRIEVNQTVTKNSDDGIAYTQIVINISSHKTGQTNGNPTEVDSTLASIPTSKQVLLEPYKYMAVSG